MAQEQKPQCELHGVHIPRQRNCSITLVEEQADPAENLPFTVFAESLAGLDTTAVVLSAGASAQARRRATIANHPAPSAAGAHAPPAPSSPWPFGSPQSVDDLSLVLRWGEVARGVRRRRGVHRGHGVAVVTAARTLGDLTSPGGEDELFFSIPTHPPPATGDTYPEAEPSASIPPSAVAGPGPVWARGGSTSSLPSIQETIFDIRRPSDALWGRAGSVGGQGEPGPAAGAAAAAVGSRADLPSERRRLEAGRGLDV